MCLKRGFCFYLTVEQRWCGSGQFRSLLPQRFRDRACCAGTHGGGGWRGLGRRCFLSGKLVEGSPSRCEGGGGLRGAPSVRSPRAALVAQVSFRLEGAVYSA